MVDSPALVGMRYDLAGGGIIQDWVYGCEPAFDERFGTKDAVATGRVDYAAVAAHDTTALALWDTLEPLLLPWRAMYLRNSALGRFIISTSYTNLCLRHSDSLSLFIPRGTVFPPS